MSAAAEAHGDHEHHGPPPIHYSSRVSPSVLGMFLFIGSEIMLFGSFFTVYFFDRVVNHGVNGQWPPAPFERPWFVAGVNTLILLTSSLTMHWSLHSIKRGHRAGMQAGLLLTFLLGLTFLLTQAIEYHRLGFNTSDSSFAATFFGPDRTPRRPCLRRPHHPGRDDDPGLPRPLLTRGPSRRRARRDLLAFRRRDVGRRLLHRLHLLTPAFG